MCIGRPFSVFLWVIDDEPEVVDPQEYAEWSADADAEFLGRMHSRYAGEAV